jgi:hypothetical protein
MSGCAGSTTCINCGCTDDHPCPGGCGWLVRDEESGLGVCSNCGQTVLEVVIGQLGRRATPELEAALALLNSEDRND